MRFLDKLPAAKLVGFYLGKHELTVIILEALDQHFYFVAGYKRCVELVQRYNAVALEPYIYDNIFFPDAYHASMHDFLLMDGRKRHVDHLLQFFVELRRFPLVLVPLL